MASPATTTSQVHFILLLLVALAADSASAATFYVTNLCNGTVWPAAIPTDGCGGARLDHGQTWRVQMPAGTAGGRIWARTGCSFVGDHGGCATGDCSGAMYCALSGKPPATLAEFTIGGGVGGATEDFYDVSVVDGCNVPMEFRCITGGEAPIRCRDTGCTDASNRPGEPKVRTCKGNSDYEVVFCPQS
ncbi:hypothetical protein ACP70R_032261 [Stipagrostis hirtigluma subsp. patula]